MSEKKKDAFRVWTGFKFGFGFMLAAYFTMALMDAFFGLAITLFAIIMRGLGFEPGILG